MENLSKFILNWVFFLPNTLLKDKLGKILTIFWFILLNPLFLIILLLLLSTYVGYGFYLLFMAGFEE